MHKSNGRLNRFFDRIERKVPPKARALRWLRTPVAVWVRVPVSILLIIGGIFSILPFLGAWMLPLGILLLAIDVAFLRHPSTVAVIKAQRWFTVKIRNWKAKKAAKRG